MTSKKLVVSVRLYLPSLPDICTWKKFATFFKGFILISALISFLDYYEILYVLENFDKSSSFLDYFLKFSVQLQNVWNHWYI